MSAAAMLLAAAGGNNKELPYVDDVFATYLRTGTGSDVTATTNIDMTKGYMLLSKSRSGATDHAIYDSARGVTYDLASNSTAGQTFQPNGLKAVSNTGHTIGSLAKMNSSGATYVDYVFREAPKFFDVVAYTGNGAAQLLNHSLGIKPGMMIVKRIDTNDDWFVYNQAIGATEAGILNSTGTFDAFQDCWNNTEPTTTQFTVGKAGGGATSVNGAQYVAYLFAHDTSADGIIQCGSFTTSGKVTLGWEPQFLLVKRIDSAGDWYLMDTMRGLTTNGGTNTYLKANTSGSEVTYTNDLGIDATGFTPSGFNFPCIYLAIRRSNKPPTTGTQVYNAITYIGNDVDGRQITGAGFAPDMVISDPRDGYATPVGGNWFSRLTGNGRFLQTASTNAESNGSGSSNGIFGMDGITAARNGTNVWSNVSPHVYVDWFFKRAPGFMDVVAYTGTGVARTVNHSLGVAPELIITKKRSGASATNWFTYSAFTGSGQVLALNEAAQVQASSGTWNNTTPTASVFSLGADTNANANGYTYIAYLFASLPGISKVGSYTGNGSNQNIECGFSTGARFILIKRTDSAGDWFVWDTVRGIVAANDPHLSLNTTSAEVTTDDSVDPYAPGFAVNQNTATNINVSGGSYIFLAIA